MWLDRLIELKKKSGMTSKQIAEGTFVPERTVSRIFHKETPNPSITTLIPIINFLDGSFDEIFADSNAIVGDHHISTLQESIATLTAERDSVIADNIALKTEVTALTNEILRIRLAHKDEIIELYKLLYQSKTNKEV